MVFVPCDEFLGVLAAEFQAFREAFGFKKKSDRGSFGDHQKSQFVRQIHHLVRIGIVGGSERISSDPAHQIVILDDEGRHIAPANDGKILVTAKAFQLNRLAV